MSSRNGYLSDQEKDKAANIYHLMTTIKRQLQTGQIRWNATNRQALCEQAQEKLEQLGFKRDYFEIRRRSDLAIPNDDDKELVILVAARLGPARLIDNLKVDL